PAGVCRPCVGALPRALVAADAVEHRGRRIGVRAFPIGILPEPFQEPAEPAVAEEVAGLLRAIAPSRLVLGVDRLDYTKGIPERLGGVGGLLEGVSQWGGRGFPVASFVPPPAGRAGDG